MISGQMGQQVRSLLVSPCYVALDPYGQGPAKGREVDMSRSPGQSESWIQQDTHRLAGLKWQWRDVACDRIDFFPASPVGHYPAVLKWYLGAFSNPE